MHRSQQFSAYPGCQYQLKEKYTITRLFIYCNKWHQTFKSVAQAIRFQDSRHLLSSVKAMWTHELGPLLKMVDQAGVLKVE